MATVDDLTAAVTAVSTAADSLIAKAEADAAAVPDFQPAVDALNAVVAKINAFLNPAPAEPAAA